MTAEFVPLRKQLRGAEMQSTLAADSRINRTKWCRHRVVVVGIFAWAALNVVAVFGIIMYEMFQVEKKYDLPIGLTWRYAECSLDLPENTTGER